MTEMTIGTLATAALGGLIVGCYLYMRGGRSGKWQRRYVGSLAIALTTWLTSYFLGVFEYWHLLVYPALVVGFSFGYGGDTTVKKVIRRTVFAVSVLSAGLVYTLTLGGNAWLVFPLHVGVGVWSIWMGIKNPIHAAAEEVVVCALLNLGLILYPFIK